MCGRITTPASKKILSELNLKYDGEPMDSHINVSPTMKLPVVTHSMPDTLQYFTWSLIPAYSKIGKVDFKTSTFNATIERLEESGLWKRLIGKKHCAIITDGFYEWQYDDPVKKKGSHPHLIRAKDSSFTYMAGLWDVWKNNETSEYVPSCSVITLPANSLMSKIHNTKGRMPAFLTEQTLRLWLDQELSVFERKKALEPVPDEFLNAVEIKKVGDQEEYDTVFY